MKDKNGNDLFIGNDVLIYVIMYGTYEDGIIKDIDEKNACALVDYGHDKIWSDPKYIERQFSKTAASKPSNIQGWLGNGSVKKDTPITSSFRKEKPCSICSRMNDIGVKSCWNCGNVIK